MAKQFSGRKSCSLAAAISAILAAAPSAQAQDSNKSFDEIIVTATRRSESVQDVPLNIAAVSGDMIQERGITDLVDISRSVPGLFVIDQGPRGANAIVVRGLNADPISGSEGLNNTSGGTVATYVGEIPVYVDLKLEDLERVEVLLGPQGTLYGVGTMGGAIRYIPKRPQFEGLAVELRGQGYSLAESDSLGGKAGFTVNVPIADSLAFRASVDYLDDPGFIDYNFLVRESGVSDPEPDFSNPAAVDANLRREKDVDFQQTLSGRAALRWQVTDAVDINLTYYYQNQKVGGRTLNSQTSFGTGRYESAQRFLEPNERTNQLTALEVSADLGFAELTSATGYSKYKELGQRDQTDLLIGLDYSYEAFPAFSAFTREDETNETFSQEVRLVSSTDGPFSWIGGVFYNEFTLDRLSQEFTPGFSQFNLDGGAPGVLRPDALEYISPDHKKIKEKAVFGELSYKITPAWQVTVGGRWYDYDLNTSSATDLPLLATTIDPDGRGPNDVILNYEAGGQSDSGSLFKFNTSYKFTTEVMAYLTVSEGYRFGNSNNIPLCEGTGGTQNVCGAPFELAYSADSTINYEIGLRTQLFDRRLTLNTSIFYVDWKDPQLKTATVVGLAPITINGDGARTQGIEMNFAANITDRLTVSGSYSYADAELTADAVGLVRTYEPGTRDVIRVDAFDGDRLPGSPKQQGSLAADYFIPIGAAKLKFGYGVSAISDVLTRIGMRGNGESLGGFALHSASVAGEFDNMMVMLYAKNLFNKYAETGVRGTPVQVLTVSDANGDPVRMRSYTRDVIRPREIGLVFTYKFEL